MDAFVKECREALNRIHAMSPDDVLECVDPTVHDCRKWTVKRFTKSNGVGCAGLFCVHCLRMQREVRKADYPLAEVIDRDAIEDARQTLSNEFWDVRRRAFDMRTEYHGAWWTAYNAYLKSPQWRAKRKLVLARDRHTCQGCGKHAEQCDGPLQVHHLTYTRVSRELMCDLTTLCRDCHDWATESSRMSKAERDEAFVGEWVERVSSLEVPF